MEGKKVDSKLLLITLILVLICLLLLNTLLKKGRTDEFWNYDEIESASLLMYLGEKVTDREMYYTLENIVNQYLNSYIDNGDEEKELYDEYYNYLTESYRDYLSKRGYKKVAKNFLDKFYINIDSNYETMYTHQILKGICKFDNDIYLCQLERKNEKSYIAFQLNESQNAFKIVYIE